MHFHITATDPYGRDRPYVHYDAGGERPATETEILLHTRVVRLEAALREIAALPDVDADLRSVIAREALAPAQ